VLKKLTQNNNKKELPNVGDFSFLWNFLLSIQPILGRPYVKEKNI